MTFRFFTRSLLAWFGMMLLAVANGTMRDFIYLPWMGASAAHQMSTIVLLLLFAFYFRWFFSRWPLDSDAAALMVGIVWCSMTVLFEWGLGARRGMSAAQVLATYDLSAGELWALIPIWVLAGPFVVRRALRRGGGAQRE